jgi:hypothetical protein
VAVIDIEDVYDEWNFGEPSPQALRAFVQHAWTTWEQRPRFVLLFGDATYDPRNYLGLGTVEYVPTKLVDTALMETSSDEWFADPDGDGVPELAIGRLPVRTEDSARRVADKLVSYARQETGTAAPRALLVMDEPDVADFEAMSTRVRAQLPSSMAVTEVRRRETGDTAAQQTIVEQLNAGAALATYIGHGAFQSWRGDLLTVAAAAGLTNRERLSVVAAVACLNGYFQDPTRESLAEALLLANGGGAVAVWTSSGMTYAPGQAALLEAWIGVLFGGDAGDQSPTLGEAAVRAKAATDDRDVRRTWIFFGDPSTRVVK